MMDRRAFIGRFTGSLLAVPLPAYAQQARRVWSIGYLGNTPVTGPANAGIWEAFRKALQERGYIEGRNVVFEQRFADGKADRFPTLAAELVRLKVDVMVVTNSAAANAAKAATTSIPIVVAGASDPVGAGLVASLAQPGGNITGIADYQSDLVPKRIELLKTAVPKAARVVSLGGNFGTFDAAKYAALASEQAAAAQTLGVTLVRVEINAPSDFKNVTAAIIREHPDALLVRPNPITFVLRRELAEFATAQRLPSIANNREHAVAGILMSYGPNATEIFRNAAVYVDKILKGGKPADLPIEQPTKLEFIVNLKTAKALGLTIPQSLLLRADEVIR